MTALSGRLHRLPDLAGRTLGGSVVCGQRRAVRRKGEPDHAGPAGCSRRTPSAPRARSTTAGRRGGAASPATTTPSSGSAWPGSSTGWSSTRPSSAATTRPRCRWRPPAWRATPSPAELAPPVGPLVRRPRPRATRRNLFQVTHGHWNPRPAVHLPRRRGRAAAGARRGRPDPAVPGGTVDLAAAENGGTITGCSDMFYASAANLIGRAGPVTMGEGWENASRRGDGNDWVSLAAPALPGRVQRAGHVTSSATHPAGPACPAAAPRGARPSPAGGPGSGAVAGDGPKLLPRDPVAAGHPAPVPPARRTARGRGAAGRLPGRRDGPAPAVGRGRPRRAPGRPRGAGSTPCRLRRPPPCWPRPAPPARADSIAAASGRWDMLPAAARAALTLLNPAKLAYGLNVGDDSQHRHVPG